MTTLSEHRKIDVGEGTYETLLTRKYERRKPSKPPDHSKVQCVIPGVTCPVNADGSGLSHCGTAP